MEIIPPAAQSNKQAPTDPDLRSTPPGVINIPGSTQNKEQERFDQHLQT